MRQKVLFASRVLKPEPIHHEIRVGNPFQVFDLSCHLVKPVVDAVLTSPDVAVEENNKFWPVAKGRGPCCLANSLSANKTGSFLFDLRLIR